MTLFALLLAAQVSNVPELPNDIPPSATLYDVLLLEKRAGQMAVWSTPDGKLRVFFQFNDRGRGPRTYSTYTLQGGLPVAVEVEGNDYMKDPVHESFEAKDGVSSWKNKAEQGSRKVSGPAFYPSMFGAPNESALLVAAALQNHGAIPLLPEGEARVRKIVTRPEATLYALSGLDFAPSYLWLDAQSRLFAIWSGWFTLVRAGKEPAMPALIQAQKKAMAELEQDRVRRLLHRPRGKLLRGADLDVASPAVREFIALLKDRHTALDLTLATFENLFLARPGAIPPGSVAIAARLPAQILRGLLAGALPMSEGTDERYRASWNKALQLVHELWAAGIPIEAGTDGLAGFTLQRELELDVQAGIPAPLVLQLATLGAARIMGLEKDLGLIRPGKLADMVLVDGNPLASISDLRKTVVTIKDGAVFETAALYRELGVTAR